MAFLFSFTPYTLSQAHSHRPAALSLTKSTPELNPAAVRRSRRHLRPSSSLPLHLAPTSSSQVYICISTKVKYEVYWYSFWVLLELLDCSKCPDLVMFFCVCVYIYIYIYIFMIDFYLWGCVHSWI
jgi:hypothetical protein